MFVTCSCRVCILIIIDILLLWTLWTAVQWRVAVCSILSHLKLVGFWKYFSSNIFPVCVTKCFLYKYLNILTNISCQLPCERTWHGHYWKMSQLRISFDYFVFYFWMKGFILTPHLTDWHESGYWQHSPLSPDLQILC